MTGYEVIHPSLSRQTVFRRYEDLAEAHIQWLISENPDQHNNSLVVFCRSCDFPEKDQGFGYPSQTAVMVGSHALNIIDSQYVFLPIIFTCATDREHHAPNVQDRNFIAWRDTLEGDYPPVIEQILIDDAPINLGSAADGKRRTDLTDFLVYTRDFTIHVPNVAYGKSLKDYLDIPMSAPGDRQAVTVGFFVLFKFNKHTTVESHVLKWEIRGVTSPQFEYVAKGVYTINVSPSFLEEKTIIEEKKNMRRLGISSVFTDTLDSLLESKKKKGLISVREYEMLKSKPKTK